MILVLFIRVVINRRSSGIPHRSRNDDKYGDMLIPGGSMIITNIWLVSFAFLDETRMLNLSLVQAHDAR